MTSEYKVRCERGGATESKGTRCGGSSEGECSWMMWCGNPFPCFPSQQQALLLQLPSR